MLNNEQVYYNELKHVNNMIDNNRISHNQN